MQITLKSTTQFADIDGTRTRVWIGTSGDGIEVRAYIATIECVAGVEGPEFNDLTLIGGGVSFDWESTP